MCRYIHWYKRIQPTEESGAVAAQQLAKAACVNQKLPPPATNELTVTAVL